MNTIKLIFGIVAILASLFYGIKATKIFNVDATKMSFAWHFHQFWFNFLGSLFGWILAYSLLPDIYNSIVNDSKIEISFARIFVLIIAFIGMTGHLPFTMMTAINYLKLAFEKILENLKH